MRKQTLLSVVPSFLLAISVSAAYADDMSSVCNEVHDKLICKAGQVANIRHMGDVILDGTTVLGPVSVLGELEMHHAQVNSLSVVGNAQADDSIVNNEATIQGNATLANMKFGGDTYIVGDTKAVGSSFKMRTKLIGDIHINNSSFDNLVNLAGKQVFFENVKLRQVEFYPDRMPQYLFLSQNTFVDGDVVFSSSNGTVYLSGGSRVGGRVLGGKVVNN